MPDGTVRAFSTVKDCCKELGITVYYVRRALRSGEKYNGMLFRDSEG